MAVPDPIQHNPRGLGKEAIPVPKFESLAEWGSETLNLSKVTFGPEEALLRERSNYYRGKGVRRLQSAIDQELRYPAFEGMIANILRGEGPNGIAPPSSLARVSFIDPRFDYPEGKSSQRKPENRVYSVLVDARDSSERSLIFYVDLTGKPRWYVFESAPCFFELYGVANPKNRFDTKVRYSQRAFDEEIEDLRAHILAAHNPKKVPCFGRSAPVSNIFDQVCRRALQELHLPAGDTEGLYVGVPERQEDNDALVVFPFALCSERVDVIARHWHGHEELSVETASG